MFFFTQKPTIVKHFDHPIIINPFFSLLSFCVCVCVSKIDSQLSTGIYICVYAMHGLSQNQNPHWYIYI